MANNHEFTLIPPNMVLNSEQPSTSSVGSGNQKGLTEFRILLPDSTLYALQLEVNCTGQDCIDQVKAAIC